MMSSGMQDEDLGPVLLTTRIIIGSLIAGLVVFLTIVVVVIKPEAEARLLLTYPAVAAALVAPFASFALSRAVAAGARTQIARGAWEPARQESAGPRETGDDASKLLAVYQTRQIIGAAIIEGAAFFALIVYMLEGSNLAAGAGVLLTASLLFFFPTRDGLRRWLEDQVEGVQEQRRLGR